MTTPTPPPPPTLSDTTWPDIAALLTPATAAEAEDLAPADPPRPAAGDSGGPAAGGGGAGRIGTVGVAAGASRAAGDSGGCRGGDGGPGGPAADGSGAAGRGPAGPAVLLAVPFGATEQHGPHLPFTVDTEIAAELVARLAVARPGVVVAPPVGYGSSGEHAGFPGTLSIGREALELLAVELVRSADDFGGVVLVSGHGGNAVPLRRAVERLTYEGRRVLLWSPTGRADDSHAGRTETSVMLALRPQAVRLGDAVAGDRRPLPELLPLLLRAGVAAASPNGVLGDPAGASAAEGRRLLDAWTAALTAAVAAWVMAWESAPS